MMPAAAPPPPESNAAAPLTELLGRALEAREAMFDEDHLRAFRLFNGFTEGRPQIVIDLYAGTAVIQNYADPPEEGFSLVEQAHEFLRERLPWLKAILLKTRSSTSLDERRGRLLMGTQPATRIKEQRIWYALDLTLTQDFELLP